MTDRARAAVLLLLAAACAPKAEPTPAADASAPAAAVHFTEAHWKAPAEADIPDDSLGASIKRGLYLLRNTPDSLPAYATSNLRCTSCHLIDGTKVEAAPLTGSHARFPKYLGRTGAVIDLAERVNYCFTRSLAGNALPTRSREMQDILAYLWFISKDVPVGTKLKGAEGLLALADTAEGDSTRGHELFTKTCQVCHGANGEGVVPPAPALWGPKSYSIGASMAREERAASFIKHNMPLNAPGSLTTQQAYDLSRYINSHPRPDSPGKEKDFPAGGADPYTPYDTYGHTAFRPPYQVLPRKNVARSAEVPAPEVAAKTTRR
jgi:thiosulfate dehydrogenase